MQKYAIAIDLGATNVRVALGDRGGRILIHRQERIAGVRDASEVSGRILKMIDEHILKAVDLNEIESVGIGSIGPLDLRKGIIIAPSNLPFREIPLVEPISNRLGKPVYLLNDCTAAALGEKFYGGCRRVDDFVYITISTGIGGGAFVDGNLLIGKDGNAAEVGHITIDYEGRLECGCGGRGHWEAYCSGRNIPNYVKYVLDSVSEEVRSKSALSRVTRLNSKTFFELARKGDELALKILSDLGELNSIGFANVIDAYDPSVITVGGSVALNNEDLILKPIIEGVSKHAVNNPPKIMITPLRDLVVLYGALALAFNPPSKLLKLAKT